MKSNELQIGDIVSRIYFIRGHKVILDSDLASIYHVETKALNQAVKRNQKRFPSDFVFHLTQDEWISLRSQIVTLDISTNSQRNTSARGKYRKFLPYVFTEHGALMLASVLSSDEAVEASLFVVRAFIKLREFLELNKDLATKIDELETKYDTQFSIVFRAIKELIQKKNEPVTPVGYRIPEKI
ncbi:MAG: ORF6N domain-containing protein [bacterium]